MYQEIFKAANDTIKMDAKLKSEILQSMENEQSNTCNKRKVPFKVALLFGLLIIMVIGITVNASSNNWTEGLTGLFSGRIRQYEWTNVSNIDFNSGNFLSTEEIENLGDETDIICEYDGLSLKITRLFTDNYSLYGIIELTAPKDFVFRTDHKAYNGSSFEINPIVWPYLSNDSTGELYGIMNSQDCELYVLRDGNDKDNTLKFAFCINTYTIRDSHTSDNSVLNNEMSLFEGNTINSIRIFPTCECEECINVCQKTNEILEQHDFELKLPDNISNVGDEIQINKIFNVITDKTYGNLQDFNNAAEDIKKVRVSNINITPFSIRYSQDKKEHDFYASPAIVFKDGQKLSLTAEVNSSSESDLSLAVARFPKPVNLDEVEAVIVGGERIAVDTN